MRLPIRARLTLVSGALMGGVLIGLGAFVYLRLEVELRETVDAGLRSRAELVLTDAGTLPPGAGRIADPEEAFAQLLSSDGRVLESTPGLPDEPLLDGRTLAGLEGVRFFDTDVHTEEETVPVRLLATTASGDTVLVVGASLEDQQEALGRLLALLVVAGPVAVALASGVGWLVSGAALRPVERLRAEADAVSSAEPGRRLAVPETGDELTRLGQSLNRMLGRFEEAVERERRFVRDASHELRTPLANLKAELDLALGRARTPDELVMALRSAAEETDRLSRLAEDLLVLARSDGGGPPLRRERLDVGRLVQREVRTFSSRAATLGVSLVPVVEDGPGAELDAARIRQAVGNLVDNALRHTRAGGRVVVEVAYGDQAVTIAVADSGDGFAPAFLDRAFDPFSRSDDARTRTNGGAGLGLTIVRAVAEAHGGSVEARNGPDGGAIVRMHLPL
jgi:two-component system OmpR family sensor kinase